MKALQIIIIELCLICFLLQSCIFNYKRGNGNIEIAEISIDNFEKINVGGNYNVTLVQSKESRVTITTDQNLLTYINTEVHNKTLNINNVHKLKSSDGIKVDIYYNTIEKLYSTGTSKIDNEGVLESEHLTISLSGAGAIDLELATSTLKVNLTGAGVITLSGKTVHQEIQMSGAGGLSAKELSSDICSINLSGLGGAEVYANEKLEATITGLGGIIYSGNPSIIERQVTGIGRIKRAEEFLEHENI